MDINVIGMYASGAMLGVGTALALYALWKINRL